jgi:hypothetical protein
VNREFALEVILRAHGRADAASTERDKEREKRLSCERELLTLRNELEYEKKSAECRAKGLKLDLVSGLCEGAVSFPEGVIPPVG